MRSIDQLRILAAAKARRNHADEAHLQRRRPRGMDALVYIAVAALAVLVADDLAGANTPADIVDALLWSRAQLLGALGSAQ